MSEREANASELRDSSVFVYLRKVDELSHHHTGIPGIENEKVNMQDIGHGKTIGGIPADEIRARTELYHM